MFKIKRYQLNVIWEPGSAMEPTMSFVQSEGGKWCKVENVELLERRLASFVTPGMLARAWYWLFGRSLRGLQRE